MVTTKHQRLIFALAWLLLALWPCTVLYAQPLPAARPDATTTYPHAPLYKIGDSNFRIPTEFVRPGEEKTGGTLPGINLYALLPDLMPYATNTRKEVHKPMSTQMIGISVRVQDALLFGHRFPILTRAAIYERITHDARTGKQREATDKQGPFGLIRRQLVPSRSSDDELYVGSKADGSLFWVLCSDRAINPLCRTQLEYSPHVTVAYHFSKKQLGEWRTLDEKVIAFVRQFQQ